MNINDELVKDYILQNGKLFETGTWNEYSCQYENSYYNDLENHFSADGDNCSVVPGKKTYILENRQPKFSGTFNNPEEKLVMEVRGYKCACGDYYDDELGYYVKESFSKMLLSILDVNVDVSFNHQ